jgi:hypothetical protein
MGGFMWLVVVGTSIWMAADAAQIDYDKRDVRGLGAMNPVGWFFAGMLLWIVAFPLYLFKRGELKAAGERRKQLMASMPHQLPPAPRPEDAWNGPNPYAANPYAANPYAANPYGPSQPNPYGHPPQPNPYGPPQHPYGQPNPHGQPNPYAAQPNPYGDPNPYAAQPPSSPSPANIDELARQIKKLDELRSAGILTEAEFQQKKSELLART